MAKINIDELSEAELIDLNHRIVERLRFLSQMRAHSQMLDFKIGEKVTFHPGWLSASGWNSGSIQPKIG